MTTAVQAVTPALRCLARLYRVETSYRDAGKQRRQASAESLIAVLRALGAPVERPEDAAQALLEREAQLASRLLEPVVVAWDGKAPALQIRLPERFSGRVNFVLETEDGATHDWSPSASALRNGSNGSQPPVTVQLPESLPNGYHRLTMQYGRESTECLVISAPPRAYTGDRHERRSWGTFMPLYALQSERSWGSGGFSDLHTLLQWTSELGGQTVSTLPLLAAFLDEPFEPSPYSPASRLFWNEFYLDATAAAEFQRSADAQEIAASKAFQRELGELKAAETVDYRRGMALKRCVLEPMAATCFETPERLRALRAFVKERPAADDYARFRAATEKLGAGWTEWPKRQRDGRLSEDDFDDDAQRYHLYVQFLAHEQLSAMREMADERRSRLYLDLPLGVNDVSYDVWREREAFVIELDGGAPPDLFFTRGQNWGFSPAHPENVRKQGYRYHRAVIGNILRYGGALRIDHVPGLHHLYCVPQGMEATEGVYIKYAEDEMYAVLSVESHKHKAWIVGEDLGTVPEYVHTAMGRHAVHRTYVTQYEVAPGKKEAIPEPRRLSVASLNTHDMPPFTAWWQGLDTDDRLELGLLTEEQAEQERREREKLRRAVLAELRRRGLLRGRNNDAASVLRALVEVLGESAAHLVLVNLEDLWGETRPQNVPGTTSERVNWRRKARYSLEEMRQREDVTSTLAAVGAARKRRRSA